jgi:ParB-like chromosome segregation protein Spo0J
MGRLTRRVKFIAKERRLSIPAEFLHLHEIERGDSLVVCTLRQQLYCFPVGVYERYTELAEQLANWCPGQEHPFAGVVRTGAKVRLGSQDRIVLPKKFPFAMESSGKLAWELVDGVLVMEPELGNMPVGPALTAPAGQGNLMDLMTPREGAASTFDRDEASEEMVEMISTARIDWRDRTFSDGPAVPGDALLRSIRVEGLRRPLVLREQGGHFQVIEGFKRLAAARKLQIRSVPALVWRGVSEDDCRRLKLMEGPAEVSSGNTSLNRLQSTIRLHQGQVALKEIEQITGRRKRTLQRYLRVAQSPDIHRAVEEGRLSIFKAEEILKAGVDPQQAIDEGWTVKTIRAQGSEAGYKRPKRQHGSKRDER